MLLTQLFIGTVLITANVVVHVACLVLLAGVISRISAAIGSEKTRRHLILLLVIAVLGLIAIHTASAWAWAVVYLIVGEFNHFGQALYFSVVTSTTLGYGDITLSNQWQLLASFESMGGLILFGASTAFLLGITRQWFNHLRVREE